MKTQCDTPVKMITKLFDVIEVHLHQNVSGHDACTIATVFINIYRDRKSKVDVTNFYYQNVRIHNQSDALFASEELQNKVHVRGERLSSFRGDRKLGEARTRIGWL